ncbi:MAG: hypothetical protein FGM22_08335 [Burkholderiaceae bacterium]|nr:hypothetical protein [Burkholderiaceae bacterium]
MSRAGYYTRLFLYVALNVLTFADQSWETAAADPGRFAVRVALAAIIAWRAFIDQSVRVAGPVAPGAAAKVAVLLVFLGFAALGVALLGGCAGYDRDYRAEVDPCSRSAFAGVSIHPGSGSRTFSGGIRFSAWNEDLAPAWRDK